MIDDLCLADPAALSWHIEYQISDRSPNIHLVLVLLPLHSRPTRRFRHSTTTATRPSSLTPVSIGDIRSCSCNHHRLHNVMSDVEHG